MNQLHNLSVLVKKECTEYIRDLKLIWLPIVFIGVGIMHPITMKLLPTMMGKVNGIILDPNAKVPSGNEIFAGVFGQLNQFGLLIVALTLMGGIVKEKQNGVLDILLSKPVSTSNYLISKYFSSSLLLLLSVVIGSLAGLYYTNIFYSPVDMELFSKSLMLYGLWFLLLITLGVTASAIANTQIQAAAITVILPTVLMIAGNYSNPLIDRIFPSRLSENAVSLMAGHPLTTGWEINIVITVLVIIGLYSLAYLQMRYKRRS
ncbi:ABC transporter permease [Paenibacillus sp. SN-8-1]|uniref:ABC transporter permease n=1 Tax=Paenibacillus sp. SN-8-1 TaxID=3435409 RepID=UPI003D9A7BD5